MINNLGTLLPPEVVHSKSRLIAGWTFEVICVHLRRGTRSAPRICAHLRRRPFRRSAVPRFPPSRRSALPPFNRFPRPKTASNPPDRAVHSALTRLAGLHTMLDADICTRALGARDPRFDGLFFVGITSTHIYCRPV